MPGIGNVGLRCVCQGASIDKGFETCLGDDWTKPIVILSAGGNDLCKVRSEELFRGFRQALDNIRSKSRIPVVCGVLPRRVLDDEWLSKAIVVNCKLVNHCKGNVWTCIYDWDLYYGKNTLYARDRLHLSCQSVGVMAGTLERELGFFINQDRNKACRKDRYDRIASVET